MSKTAGFIYEIVILSIWTSAAPLNTEVKVCHFHEKSVIFTKSYKKKDHFSYTMG
jgi:hypothetical protein